MTTSEELIQASKDGNYGLVKKLATKENVNDPHPKSGITALHAASLHGRADVASYLIDRGADVNALDGWSCTPLHNAAGAGHADIVDALIKAGSKLDARSANKGKTPLEIARLKGQSSIVDMIQNKVSRQKHAATSDVATTATEVGAVVRNGSGQSDSYRREKENLMKRLRKLEREEELHSLRKTELALNKEIETVIVKYKEQIERLQGQIHELQDRQNNEIKGIQENIKKSREKMEELTQSNSD